MRRSQAKPVLKRLSSLNLSDTNIPEARNLGSSLTASLQDTRLISKHNKTDKNISTPGSDKWVATKEKFLENITQTDEIKTETTNVPKINLGAVLVKESFIEPPRISRVSKSFHGQSSNPNLDIANVPRRASDCISSHKSETELQKPINELPNSSRRSSELGNKSSNIDRKLFTQLSHPGPSSFIEIQKHKFEPIKTEINQKLIDITSNLDSVEVFSQKSSPKKGKICPLDEKETLTNVFQSQKSVDFKIKTDENMVAKSSPKMLKKANFDRQFVSQLSQPSSSNITHSYNRKASLNLENVAGKNRFTTIKVDEAEHAASVNQTISVSLTDSSKSNKIDPTLTLANSSCLVTRGFDLDKK